MAKIRLQPEASSTNVFTIATPAGSSNRTLTLPDSTGTLLDENSSVPAANLTGTVADARISALTASKLTGALPAISGASLTNLPIEASRYFYARSPDTSTYQSISHATHTKVELTWPIQSHSAFSDANDKWTATADDAGDWLFLGQASFYVVNSTMDNPIVSIAVNGTRVAGSYNLVFDGTDDTRHYTVQTTAVLTIADGDYVELYAHVQGSGTMWLFGGDTQGYKQTSITGVKL